MQRSLLSTFGRGKSSFRNVLPPGRGRVGDRRSRVHAAPVTSRGGGATWCTSTGATLRGPLLSDDPEWVRSTLSDVYYPLSIDRLELAEPFAFDMTTVELGSLTLGRLNWGSDVRVDCSELETAYHVNIPLSGRVASVCGEKRTIATPDTAAVFTPTGRTVIEHWPKDSPQLCLKIERQALESALMQRLDVPTVSWVEFRFDMSLGSPAVQGWMSALGILSQELSRPGGLAAQPLLAAEVQQLIITGLLLSQVHNYSEALNDPAPAPRPRAVRRAIEVIDARPDFPWTVPDLAAIADVSVRSLERGFRSSLGISPRAYLRGRRMQCAHEELRRAVPGEVTVTDVACRWGFTHLGRFADAHRRTFGVTPSETLRGTERFR